MTAGAPSDPYENLAAVLGAGFDRGWRYRHSSADECLEEVLDAASAELRSGAAAEIDLLLDGRLCESQIRDALLYEMDCHYAPEEDGLEASAWLRRVRDRLVGATLVFAYGSNLDPARMRSRVGTARFVACARLEGFELRFHKRGSKDGTGKANAVPTEAPHAAVHGVVYEITREGLVDLDAHEGGYERRSLAVALEADGEPVEAWVYLARPDTIDETLTPEPWYLDHVLTGARSHGLPSRLVQELEALRARSSSP